ncbi:MAG: GxxExxY protein [Candidatus Pelagisphaera sp.]|jgi:GxxExxY protein
MLEEELTNKIIGAAIEVHKHWGPGLYEEIYERSLCRELSIRGLAWKRQLVVPLIYKDEKVGEDLRLDIIVENKVVIEAKHVKELLPLHDAQLMTYLKLTNCRAGLLINFNVTLLKNGLRRIVV